MSINGSAECVEAKRTYTVEEIRKILDIGRTFAYKLVHSGSFRTVQVGTTIRISKSSFDTWLDNHPTVR